MDFQITFSAVQFLIFPLPLFQSGWSIPVELVVGPLQKGIAYMTDSAISVRRSTRALKCFDNSLAREANSCSRTVVSPHRPGGVSVSAIFCGLSLFLLSLPTFVLLTTTEGKGTCEQEGGEKFESSLTYISNFAFLLLRLSFQLGRCGRSGKREGRKRGKISKDDFSSLSYRSCD